MHQSSSIFETNSSRHWDTGGVATPVMMKEATPEQGSGKHESDTRREIYQNNSGKWRSEEAKKQEQYRFDETWTLSFWRPKF